MAPVADWDTLEARARGAVPAHRLGWFLSLLRQGRDAELLGRARLAGHCRARVESELAAFVATIPAVSAAPAAPPSALAALAARRGHAARTAAFDLLERKGAVLPEAERAAFRAALESATDAQMPAWRRRLVDRLLRAARYRRKAPGLLEWGARGTAAPAPAAPAGPYNDFAALDEMLRRVAASHPEWAAEFFDVYAEMDLAARVYGELVPRR